MMTMFRYVHDGIGYPSVTEILKVIPKPGLQEWRDKTPNADIISRDRATIGTTIHWKIQRYFAEKFDKPPEAFKVDDLSVISHNTEKCSLPNCFLCSRKKEMVYAIETLFAFFNDFRMHHDLLPMLLEKTIYNSEYGYAGTMDFYGLVDGKLSIIDWKTSKGFFEPCTWHAQLAAYKKALGKDVEKLYVLRMHEENWWELREMDDDWKTFEKALIMFREQKPEKIMQKVK
jgi:hypothetical protein